MSTEEKSDLINIKNITNAEEFRLDRIELLKGETPENIVEKCLQLCKEYLSGNWSQQSVNTIKVRRITGGLTNQLYYCAIGKPAPDQNEVSQEVVIRIYGEKYFNNLDNDGNERLTDVVIGLMVSQNKLGPKIYGVFESGQIQRYYPHRPFGYEERKNPQLVREVFQKLARVHAMDVPLKKDAGWLFKDFDNFYKQAFENQHHKQELDDLFVKLNCETLMKHNLKHEINWLRELVSKTKSPIVFTHNDFRSSNIMVLENNQNNEIDDQIVLCDFEYSGYGYRGFDFQFIVNEWSKPPNANRSNLYPLNESIIRPLIQIYILESEDIFGETYSLNSNNSLENIINEIKIFSLISTMFKILFMLKNDDKSGLPINRKVSLQLSEQYFKRYFELKNHLKQQNLIDY